MTCIHDTIFNFSKNFKESAPSCHDEEACSRVRHGSQALELLHVVRRQGEIYFLIPKRTYAVHQRSKHDTAIIIFFF